MEHCAPAIASGVVSSDSSRTLPSPSSNRQAVRMDEKLPNAALDPCVDVATAPAMVCVSMSPWFCSASPASHKGAPNWAMVVCALAVAVRALASIAESPLNCACVEQNSVGAGYAGEGMPGAWGSEAQAGAPRFADRVNDILLLGRRDNFGRHANSGCRPSYASSGWRGGSR